jgi:hypothetical protein
MDPINYLSMVPQVDLGQKFLTGLQAGAGLGEIQDQAAARQLALQQKQAAMQRAQQYQSDVGALLAAPRDQQPQLAAKLAMTYPEQYEPITKGFGMLTADQQKTELQDASTIVSVLHVGRQDLALREIDKKREALKNSGQSTAEMDALRDEVEKDPKAAHAHALTILAALPGGKDILANLSSIGEESRKGAESESKLSGEALDQAAKAAAVTGAKAGALAQAKNLKPSQVETFLRSEAAAGRIPKAELADRIAEIPQDSKALPGFLNGIRDAGMKPDDQKKFTTPDANTVANNDRIAAEGRANRQNNLDVQDRIAKRLAAAQEVKVKHGALGLSTEQNDALFGENGAVTTGKLDPNKINSRTAGIFADAFIRNPNADFAKISSDINSGRKADAEFSTGKLGNSIRSFNVGIAHLDTLGQLADALGNGDAQAVNRIGNYFATQTGQAAPTNFHGAKKIVGDEIVKAIVGSGGGVADREEAGKIIDAANSPAQLKGAIKTVQELMVGQLGGLEQQYKTTTRRDDFDAKLSPRALEIRSTHGAAPAPAAPGRSAPAAAAAPAIPTGWTVREH